jgi:hypothetical protein
MRGTYAPTRGLQQKPPGRGPFLLRERLLVLGAIADAVMIVVGYPHGVYRIAFFDSLDVGRVITFVAVSDAPSLSVRVSFPTGTVHSNSIAPGSAAKRAR